MNYVDPCGMEALNACRLIALDKMPGIRSMGGGRQSGEENHRKSHLEDCDYIPAVTGRYTITDEDRDLFSLPIRDGGLGITIPHQTSSQQRLLSQTLCAPVVEAVLNQQQVLDPDLAQKLY